MKKAITQLFLILFLFCKSTTGFAYPYPPPIDIPIQNNLQNTNVWCWAAVAQQIIQFKNGAINTPQQCAMVALSKNAPIPYCCSNFNNCAITGSLTEIQALLHYFGGSFSSYSPPTDPMSLYYTLAQNKPVIMQISTVPRWIPFQYEPCNCHSGYVFPTNTDGRDSYAYS